MYELACRPAKVPPSEQRGDALAHLAMHYRDGTCGLGVDLGKAEELMKEGVEEGSGIAMLVYAELLRAANRTAVRLRPLLRARCGERALTRRAARRRRRWPCSSAV